MDVDEARATRADRELLLAFARGDDHAFEILVQRHGSGIKSYAHRMLRNAETAEDVYVETFTRVVQERSRIRPIGSVRGYLYTIAHHLCISLLRRRGTERDGEYQISLAEHGWNLFPDGEDHTRAAELFADLEHGISRLSSRHREVLLLRVVHGLSTRETGLITGQDDGQVRSQLSWARKRLRSFLEPRSMTQVHEERATP
jgi:RNA polymerase sigma-70 factor (ECF subfamily)